MLIRYFVALFVLVSAVIASWAAGGPILPSSIYVGGASGKLYPYFAIPGTNTNMAGAVEGVGAVGSLTTTSAAVLQFNLPEVIPGGTPKLRILSFSTASSGTIAISVSDGQVAPLSNIGTNTLANEPQVAITWAVPDAPLETKIALTTVPATNDIYTVLVTYVGTGTLAAPSVWQFSIVWE